MSEHALTLTPTVNGYTGLGMIAACACGRWRRAVDGCNAAGQQYACVHMKHEFHLHAAGLSGPHSLGDASHE